MRKKQSQFSVERLEPRLALDAGGVQRPTLERSHDIYLSNVGPAPIVFGKSDISITTDSFVVTAVAHGTVEKWVQADGWVDVSTKPTTSNPRELLKLLQRRVFSKGDRLRWIPAVQDLSTDIATQAAFTSRAKAFEVHDWGRKTEESTDPVTRPEPVENFAVTQAVDGNFTATWGGVPADPTIIRAEYGVASGSDAGSHDGWGMMRPDSGRFEASDLVWHEGLQRFFAVADDGGYLATFTYDGTTVTEVGGPGDYKVDRYWKVDVAGLLADSTVSSSDKAKLQEMHIDQSTSFEGLTFKQSSDATEASKIIYIGVESEWDEENSGPKIGNKIIEFNFSEAFDVNGDWVFGEGEQPGKITQVFDLGYKHDNKDKGGKDDPMPVHGDVSFAAGLEALTFVPNEVNGTEGLFYAGRQKDGKVYKLNLNQSTTGIVGAVERIGDFTFDSVKNPGYPDLGALQYVEVGGSQYVLALFGEGPATTQGKTEDSRSGGAVNPDAVRIALATLDGHVTQTWDQEGAWNEFDTESDDWMTSLRGPEGISYFEINGVPHLAFAQDPGGSQRDQGTNYDPVNGFSPTDGGRIGQVKFFSGFDLDAPQVTSTLKVNEDLTIPGIRGGSYELPAQQSRTKSQQFKLYSTALNSDGTTSVYQSNVAIPVVHYEEYEATGKSESLSFETLDGWTVFEYDDQHSQAKYVRENVTIDPDGSLRIKVTARESDGKPLSGRVMSNHRQKYGLIIYKTKQIPKAVTADSMLSHLWPALWTVGWIDDEHPWPEKGEIDVMETVRSHAERPDFTSRIMAKTEGFSIPVDYTKKYYASIPQEANGIEEIQTVLPSAASWSEPHTFAVDWYEVNDEAGSQTDVMFDFYLDVEVGSSGYLVPMAGSNGTVSPIKSYSLKEEVEAYNANPVDGVRLPGWEEVFESWGRHGVVLNVAVGGDWNGNYNDQITVGGANSDFATHLPVDGTADMVIEYVKAFTRSD